MPRRLVLLLLAFSGACRCQPGPERSHADESVRPVYPALKGEGSALANGICAAVRELPEQRRAECCHRPARPLLFAECVRNLDGAISSGAVTANAKEVDACREAASRAWGGCAWVGPNESPVPDPCVGLLHGTRAAGAVCRSSLECESGLHCAGAGPTQAGVCAPPQPAGTACGLGTDVLVAYARQERAAFDHRECDGFCDHHRCQPPKALGEGCVADEQCGANHHCAANRCADGVLAALGMPCVPGGCAGEARCLASVCVSPKRSGACGEDAECLGACVRPDAGGPGECGLRCP